MPRTVFILIFFFLAEQVTNNLKELAQQVTPGDIVSMYGVRKAMGISIPSPAVEDNLVDLTEGMRPGSLGEHKPVVSEGTSVLSLPAAFESFCVCVVNVETTFSFLPVLSKELIKISHICKKTAVIT